VPPRFSYWTILLDGKPTAFRAAEQGELLPTFKRLQEKHPDAVMRWFARGRLWSSPEEARSETARRADAADAAARGRNWRPGGSHRDPRQPYKDAKKQRNQERRQRRFDYRAKDDQAGGANKDRGPKKEWNDVVGPGPREPKPWSDRPKPAGRWPRDERRDRPGPKTGGWDKRPARPRDDRLPEARAPKKDWSGPPAEGRREFKPWHDRPTPAGRWPRDERQDRPGPKTGGWDKRPARPRDDRLPETRAPKKDWSRPPAEGRREFKPWTDRPKPVGRWPRDERPGGPGPKGGWNKRPVEPRDAKPWNKPGQQGGPPETGEREPRRPWQGPNQQDRPPLPGTRPPSNRPPRSRAGDRPFKGPRDSGFRGNEPSKGPRGPKR
jgi:hypothetical protein